MKRILIATSACSLLVLAACNTVAGIGRDVQSVGETVEDVAE